MAETVNQQRVIRFLATRIGKDHSINDIARECNLAPNGAYKILTKFEKQGAFKVKTIANIKSYSMNFDNEKTRPVLELAFTPNVLEGRVKLRAEDLQRLKSTAKACILFGSYITQKEKPGDLDVLFVLEKKDYERFRDTLAKVQDLVPVKIQDVVQTPEDLKDNLKKGDPIVMVALQKGIVLWGSNVLAETVKNANK